MNQNDKEFLHGMMLERMTQHYGAAFPKSRESAKRLGELEKKLNQALKLLLTNLHKGYDRIFVFQRILRCDES